MNTIGQNIKKRRKELGITQSQLAEVVGYTDKSTIAKIESGEREMPSSKLEKVALALRTSPAYLMGMIDEEAQQVFEDNFNFIATMQKYNLQPIAKRKIMVLGEIACGHPIYATEDIEYVTLADVPNNADFILIAKGDSMINARIYDGDYVFIQQQHEVHNGEIAAVIINDEATLKRVYFDEAKQKIVLQAENPAYEPLVFVGKELEQIRILGKAIAFQSEVR